MSDVYALLVGINKYRANISWKLGGCVNDITDVEEYLGVSVPSAKVRKLCDEQATRDSVIEGFRRHLGQARQGDVALFWFSGHGSRWRVPPHLWHSEDDGVWMQSLVCVDSQVGDVPDLFDKELALLISEVAARGPHVTVVLDSCYSGGATRDVPSIGVRRVEPVSPFPDPDQLLVPLTSRLAVSPLSGHGVVDHVALAACQRDQVAYERADADHVRRGVFTAGLLTELRRGGSQRSYRELMAATRGYVENYFDHQSPALYPQTESIVDEPFLGGHPRTPATTMTIRCRAGSWILDAGRCHGLVSGSGENATRVAVHGSSPIDESRVVGVATAECVVEPLDWIPDESRTYPVVLSYVPLPRTTVTVGGGKDDDDRVARRVVDAISVAGAGGRLSPHLRLVRFNDEREAAELAVQTPTGGLASIVSADGAVLAQGATTAGPSGEVPIVTQLEHIARWRKIRELENPSSGLANLVQVHLLPPQVGETVIPKTRAGEQPGSAGVIKFEYTHDGRVWKPPSTFIRLDNTSGRKLYCVLLDLTDQFRIHASLFPGSFLEPGVHAAAGGGHLVDLTLPSGRPVKPGAHVRDWLMLIVSEERISSEHFLLPAISAAEVGKSRESRSALGLVGVVERLGLSARYRDFVSRSAAAADWWTSVIEVVTSVPKDWEAAR